MADVKISDAVPVEELDPTDMIPLARVGHVAPYSASMQVFAEYVTLLASTAPPRMSAVAAAPGTANQYARADHVHPSDGTRAPLDSPHFTGNPVAPTAQQHDASYSIATTEFVMREIEENTADIIDSPLLIGTPRAPTPGIDDNTDLIATTEYVQNQGGTAQPTMNGAVIPGVSRRWSREDHVHPTDATRAATGAIPNPASSLPVMDGTAVVGGATTWARADHVHPSDTSRYAASNPSGFQTAGQVTTIARTGTTTNDNAAAGQIGEFLSARLLSTSPLALPSGVDTVLLTLALTAGDWDVWGSIGFTMASNNNTILKAWLNAGGVTAPSIDQFGGNVMNSVANNTPQAIVPLPPMRVSAASPVNVALGSSTTTGGGTISGWGKIMARRVR